MSTCADEKKENSAGTLLRETREGLGLSLDDAARVTRIGKGHLAALEEGLYDRLPSAVYVKGFLRAYAAYLKIPENRIFQAYEKDLSDTVTCSDDQDALQTAKEKIEKKPEKVRKPSERNKWLYIFTVALVVAAALAISYLFVPSPTKENAGKEYFPVISSAAKPSVPVMPAGENVNTSENVRPQEQQEQQAGETEAGTPEVPATPAASSKGMVLKIKVVEDGWLDITIDDAVSQHYDLKSGDLIEWKGEKSISLDVGNAGGVEVELDGKTLKTFGKKGESAHVLLKPGGVVQ
ncbi:MAG TPA: RodZ domain-containing protein [Geobacteraceae bacterium]|nr:RodZ domain-containing protein [Geobacteraceae bacterium]